MNDLIQLIERVQEDNQTEDNENVTVLHTIIFLNQ